MIQGVGVIWSSITVFVGLSYGPSISCRVQHVKLVDRIGRAEEPMLVNLSTDFDETFSIRLQEIEIRDKCHFAFSCDLRLVHFEHRQAMGLNATP